MTAEVTRTQAATWAQQGRDINTLIQRARWALASGKEDPDTALFRAQELSADHQRSLNAAAGVHAPQGGGVDIPLDRLDTPASRELLAVLRQAVAVAERVDAERGRALPADVPLLPGESRGTDLAETLSTLLLRVRLEVEGPQGRD